MLGESEATDLLRQYLIPTWHGNDILFADTTININIALSLRYIVGISIRSHLYIQLIIPAAIAQHQAIKNGVGMRLAHRQQ